MADEELTDESGDPAANSASRQEGPSESQGRVDTPTDDSTAGDTSTPGDTSALDLAQDEINSLLSDDEADPVTTATESPEATAAELDPPRHAAEKSGDDVEFLIRQASEALQSSATAPEVDASALYALPEFPGTRPSDEKATLELLKDVELDLKIELGRTHMHLEDVLKLQRGSVVTLDKLAGDPVDVYANGRLVARGEVLVLNDNFCIRVAELVSGQELS